MKQLNIAHVVILAVIGFQALLGLFYIIGTALAVKQYTKALWAEVQMTIAKTKGNERLAEKIRQDALQGK